MVISQVITSLGIGGAERVAINLANYWVSQGHEVDLIVLEPGGGLRHLLDHRVKVLFISCVRFRRFPLAFLRYLLTRKPNVSLVHMWPLTSFAIVGWFLSRKIGKLFTVEHVGLSHHIRSDLTIPIWLGKLIVSFTYKFASGNLAVSRGAANDLAAMSNQPVKKIRVIYNPIINENELRNNQANLRIDKKNLWGGNFKKYILSVGTLKPQKNHLFLLHGLHKVLEEFDAGLLILGDGPKRLEIDLEIRRLRLSGRVKLAGAHPDPAPWFSVADLFVLSSNFEGFANVIVEALGHGVPVVSTDCDYGPAEILDNGKYGRLVPVGNTISMEKAVRESLSINHNKNRLMERASHFSIARQAHSYLRLFTDT